MGMDLEPPDETGKSELAQLIEKADVKFTEQDILKALDEYGEVLNGQKKKLQNPVEKIFFLGPQVLYGVVNHIPKAGLFPNEKAKYPLTDFIALNRVIHGQEPRV